MKLQKILALLNDHILNYFFRVVIYPDRLVLEKSSDDAFISELTEYFEYPDDETLYKALGELIHESFQIYDLGEATWF